MTVANDSDDEMRDRLARASHDLGNFLGVVLNYAMLLRRQISDPTMLADLGNLRAAAERAVDIARDLAVGDRSTDHGGGGDSGHHDDSGHHGDDDRPDAA